MAASLEPSTVQNSRGKARTNKSLWSEIVEKFIETFDTMTMKSDTLQSSAAL
jgi:hypothetical protein